MGYRGLRYTHLYNSARCCPSRASLLTGLHPHQAGIGWMTNPTVIRTDQLGYQGFLNNSCMTIAEVLKLNGYRTFLSGKWHVGNTYDPLKKNSWTPGQPGFPIPTQRGFEQFFGTLDGAGSFYTPPTLMRNEIFIQPESPDFFYADEIGNYATKFIKESINERYPFFGYIAFTAPHWPLHAPQEDISIFENYYKAGWDSIRTARHEEQILKGIISSKWQISPRDEQSWPFEQCKFPEWESLRMSVYAAQIHRMDIAIGKIIKTLKERFFH